MKRKVNSSWNRPKPLQTPEAKKAMHAAKARTYRAKSTITDARRHSDAQAVAEYLARNPGPRKY